MCETRKHVVLARGKIPCDVLFIGEAPGESEDVLGQPFVGPAGKLLDRLIGQSEAGDLKIAYTNVIGCFPRNVGEDNRNVKFTQPPKEAVKACRERLLDFVDIVKPKAVVFAGKFAWDSSRTVVSERLSESAKMVMISHPAAILRAEEARRGIAEHQVRVILTDLFYEIRGQTVPF